MKASVNARDLRIAIARSVSVSLDARLTPANEARLPMLPDRLVSCLVSSFFAGVSVTSALNTGTECQAIATLIAAANATQHSISRHDAAAIKIGSKRTEYSALSEPSSPLAPRGGFALLGISVMIQNLGCRIAAQPPPVGAQAVSADCLNWSLRSGP